MAWDRRTLICMGAAAALAPAAAWGSIPSNRRSRAAAAAGASRLAPALQQAGLTLGSPAFIQITKHPGELCLFLRQADGRFRLLKAYPVCAMSGGLGPKQREGDMQAPEGLYSVRPNQLNPASSFHLSFNLGFPNAYERAQGWTGSFLMVHGACASIGCYAMTDPAIEEIWAAMTAAFGAGQTAIAAHCFPFPMTQAALAARAGERWIGFWRDLEPAWRLFAETGRPPRVRMRGGRYLIG